MITEAHSEQWAALGKNWASDSVHSLLIKSFKLQALFHLLGDPVVCKMSFCCSHEVRAAELRSVSVPPPPPLSPTKPIPVCSMGVGLQYTYVVMLLVHRVISSGHTSIARNVCREFIILQFVFAKICYAKAMWSIICTYALWTCLPLQFCLLYYTTEISCPNWHTTSLANQLRVE